MRNRVIGKAVGLSLVALLLALAAPLHAAATTKPLTRFHDPVIVQTSAFAGLTTDTLRLYSVRRGKLVPIPYQFDARDEAGQFVLAGDPGSLDDNDELVFMAKDAGPRLSTPAHGIPASDTIEIEVFDPLTGGRGWAYLLRFDSRPPQRSPRRYVSADRSGEVRTPFYRVRYADGHNYFQVMEISREAGGSGENVLQRTRVRGQPSFHLLLTTWNPEFTEDDAVTELDGIRTGPVRSIHRWSVTLDLGRTLPDVPSGTTSTIHYASSFVMPTTFKVPPMVMKLVRDFEFEQFNQFRPGVVGMTYWDGAHPQGLRFTGNNAAVVDDATTDHDWWVASGDAGTMMQAFLIPDEWTEWGVTRGTVFVDGADSDGSDDRVFAAGYALRGMTQVRKPGDYALLQATFVLPERYQSGDEHAPMAMLKTPVRASVTRGVEGTAVKMASGQQRVGG